MGIIEDLKHERAPDSRSEKQLLVKMYENCLKMIKFKNKYGTTEIVHEVPPIMLGFALYDIGTISYKLNKLLKKEGFKTTFQHPNKIFIKW